MVLPPKGKATCKSMIQLEIAVPTPLPRTFTYLSDRAIEPGTRVLVPFGRRRLVGVTLGPATAPEAGIELRRIESVIDEAPVYSPQVLEIARWISTYYMHPLGEVLRTMLPAGAAKVIKESLLLTEAGAVRRQDQASAEGRLLLKLFGKKKTEVTRLTATSKMRKLAAAGDLDAVTLDMKALTKAGLVAKSRGSSMRARAADDETRELRSLPQDGGDTAPLAPPPLTATQQAVVRKIVDEGLGVSGSKVFLLHGVTGSGKTEVYLRLIAEAMAKVDGAQTLVLVPEISLTPQMTRVFERRFPGIVAVVHSAMTDVDRWAQLTRVRTGAAKILIGPRSAVFGPFQSLRLLIVDEEHDGSYKQSTGLTYNGRDVAVLRGKLEGAPVVLGSATPSMESYNNALTGRYALLEMPERVTGRPLPEIEVVASERGHRKGAALPKIGASTSKISRDFVDDDANDVPIAPKVLAELQANLAAGRQAIVLVNRRGYAYYLFSLDDKKAIQCPNCSISLTLHSRSTVLRCHYCDYQTTVDKVSRERPEDTLIAVGYGSQKAEDCLQAKLPQARIVRLDSDTVADRDVLPRVLGKFRTGEIDILVGTQILAKGHDFPNVTLIVILEVDQLLGLPDFRAGERTFQLIVQAAGRAGRAELAGRVLIQTMRAAHGVVTSAIAQDYKGFADNELRFRQAHSYPPFSRMISIELNGPDKVKLADLCRRIEDWVEQVAAARPELLAQVRVLGPAAPPIETIRGRHRRSILFTSAKIDPLRSLAMQFCTAFQKLPHDIRLKIDVDPQSLI